jgi:hypothetical protein
MVYVIAAAIIILVIILASSSKSANDQTRAANEKMYADIANKLPEESKRVLLKAIELYESNNSYDTDEYYKELGIKKEVGAFEKLFAGNAIADEMIHALSFTNSLRIQREFAPIETMDKVQAYEKYQVNLHNHEVLYDRLVAVEYHEEKTVSVNKQYSGTNWNAGSYHSGRISYTTEVVKDFVIQDVGRLYVTNKRLVFEGKHKNVNKSISFDKIINFKLYQDGILLGTTSGAKPLIKFQTYDNTKRLTNEDELISFNDGMNRFVRIVGRVLNGTAEIDLTPKKEIQG